MPPVNPQLLVGFDTNETNTATPSPTQQSDGYQTNEIPLAENHGFMFNQFYKWLNYLKSVGTSQWDNTVAYPQHGRTMRNGVIYKSLSDANTGNDPLTQPTFWEIDQWRVITTTHNITVDANYTLTVNQNTFGRIIITDTNPFLTVARDIIVDNLQKSFIAQNDTLQTLTFKTSGGTGIEVLAGASITLYNDGTNVISAGQNIYVVDSTYVDPLAVGANPAAVLYSDGKVVGSTDNGEYVVYPDGRKEATGVITPASNNNDGTLWTYPIVFNNVLKVNSQVDFIVSGGLAGSAVTEIGAISLSSFKAKTLNHTPTTIIDIVSRPIYCKVEGN